MFKSYEERREPKRRFVGDETPKEFAEPPFYFRGTAFRQSGVSSLELARAFRTFPYLKTMRHETL